MLPSPQIKLIFVLTIICVEAKKPPGYMEPPKVPDPNPPKYEYGYAIADGKGDGQGKQEQRDGIYALGRYYVQGKGSRQNVQYFADDWGYHPVVEFSSTGPHSRVTSHFALGEEAVKQLKNKENNLPQLQGILENADKLDKTNAILPLPDQLQQKDSDQPQQILLQSSQEAKTTVSPTPTTISTLETSGPFHQQDLQTQVLQTTDSQQGFEDQTLIEIDVRNQQELQETQQTQQERQSEQFLEFKTKSESQPKEETLEHRQRTEQHLQQLQQELQNLAQEQNQSQDDSTKPAKLLIEENQQSQLQILQQEQIQQIFDQQPQIQQQVSIQELQLNPQQAILKHEEPGQKVIFPQEQRIVYDTIPQDVYQKQHPNDNIISSTDGTNQQLVYVQNQQSSTQPHQQLLIQTDIIHTQPEVSQQTVEERRYETAALFENSNSKLVHTQQLVNEDRQLYDDSNLSTKNLNFGSKLTTIQDTTNKLIEHTKNLVTGQDVLNINEAIFKNDNAIIDSNTPSTEYTKSHLSSSESATNSFSYANVGFSTTTPLPISGPSLNDHPIVVADFDENTVQSSTEHFGIKTEFQEEYHSSTSVAEENLASNSIDVTEPSTVLVTPRPISTNFLAPITAGIQLQNIELQAEERKNTGSVNYNVEIQKSVPYYLGKFEYPSSYEQGVTVNETANAKSSAEIKATENIELGKTLLFFPGQSPPKVQIRVPNLEVKRPYTEASNYVTVQNVPSTSIRDHFIEVDQQQAQGINHQVAIQHVGQQQAQGYQYNVGNQNTNTNIASLGQLGQKNTEITKIIHKPYPVRVPYEVPYPVVKQVQVPVTVQRIVEKPIHITKYVEKPVPIPQPYPVEKIVDRPVHIPVHVTKYIDRPYPVEVRVPYPQPYPVEKVVQKIVKQPYPVEVRVPVHVEKIVEKKVPVPHYIERPVEKIVEKPVPHYVDRPVPVEVKVPVPQPYLVRVEVPKPYPVQVNKPVQNSYGVVQAPHVHGYGYFVPQKGSSYQSVQVSVPQQIYHHSYFNSQQEQQAQQSQQTQTYLYANPYAYAPQINHYLPPKQEIILNNGYLPSKPNTNFYLPPKKDCNLHTAESSLKSLYYTFRPDDYLGLLPPKLSNAKAEIMKKLRTARSNFDDKSVRMEYGFLPPLIPSLEIDEQGNPIEKGDK